MTPAPNTRRLTLLCLAALAAGYFLSGSITRWMRDDAGVEHDFEAMRTYARITIPKGEGNDGLTPAELAQKAEEAVREISDLMGPVGNTSDVRALNEAPAGTWVELNPLTWRVLMEALRFHRLSGGAFDPTIGPVKKLFKFERAETDFWPAEDDLRQAQESTGADKILYAREGMRAALARPGMRLDFGAIAKGYGADRAAEVLAAHGVRNALINIGGELRVMGLKPGSPATQWRAGIRNPRDDSIIEELPLSDAAVATSGDYENYFIYKGQRYEHIIDPRTKLPLTERVASVTVIHPTSCMIADALATTLCVLGPEAGAEFVRSQALGLFSGGVRVIMLCVRPGGTLARTELVVSNQGEFSQSTSDVQ